MVIGASYARWMCSDASIGSLAVARLFHIALALLTIIIIIIIIIFIIIIIKQKTQIHRKSSGKRTQTKSEKLFRVICHCSVKRTLSLVINIIIIINIITIIIIII